MSYGVCQEIVTGNLNMRCIASSSRQFTPHTSLKTTEFVTSDSMVIIPHPPYQLDLARCDSALFPKLKMKLKGHHFGTMSNIQRKLQVVLVSSKENDFHEFFEV
jgi:hypothetical protein